MKRAFSTLTCIELTLPEVLALANRCGIHGIEMRLSSGQGLDNAQTICGLGIDQADHIRQLCHDAGVCLTDLATGVTAKEYDVAQLDVAKRCVDLASAVDCPALRIFVGAHVNRFSDPVKQDEDGIVRFLKELCPYAADHHVQIWLETHSTYSTGRAIRRLIDAVGAPNLYALWDLIHSIEFGESPAETVQVLGDRLAHVHLKDGRHSGDRNRTQYIHTTLGEGEMPLGLTLSLLHEAGYEGYVSLEWEKPWRPELRDCYPDAEATLIAYNHWLDMAETNLLPPLTSSLWQTAVPEAKPLASFTQYALGDRLGIELSSDSYGVGKWLCTVPMDETKTYQFSVACKTAAEPNDVYVLLTQLDEKGKLLIREHALDCKRVGNMLFFSDTVTGVPGATQFLLELWCKGKYASVEWFEPFLVPREPVPERNVKIAIAYLKPFWKPNMSLADNREAILDAVDRAGKTNPDIILLGEAMYDRGVDLPLSDKVETDRGSMCTLMRQKAKEYHCYLIYNFHEWDNGEIYNTSILLDREGNTVGKYHKTHLTVTELEMGMTPGTDYPVFDTDFGRIGILICWDHYFPATADILTNKGAEILFVSSAGDAAEQCIARAKDNGIYIAVCGMNTENSYGWGPARVVSPLGEFLAQGTADREPVVCQIDLNKKVRRYWLSVGPADAQTRGVYRYEKRHHVQE